MVITAFAPGVYGRIDASVKRSAAVTQRNITALKSAYWLLIASGFFEPLLYLLSIGYGLGKAIGPVPIGDGRSVSYQTFVAPSMLAASAMTGALSESTFNFFAKMKFSKLYDAVLATPVRAMEIALGELWWAMARGAIYAAAFIVVMVAMDLTTVVWAPLAFLATLFVGFAFGSVGMALSTYMRSWQDFDLIGTVQVALFLFSGTFTPLSVYHFAPLRWLIMASPLYQSVALVRAITLGRLDLGALWHVAYLIVMAGGALWLASRRMNKLLLK